MADRRRPGTRRQEVPLLLAEPVLHDEPFPFLTATGALGPAHLPRLAALFDEALPWVRHDSFYHCFMADLDDRLDAVLATGLAVRLRALLAVPLTDHVTATAQRMEPGDHALPHTDRPLVGYEAVRLIVQLDPGWTPADGGLFQALADARGERVVRSIPPLQDSAVGFAMTTASHHEVTPTHRTRRSVVFHFTHVGNTDALRRYVEGLFDGMSFAALPAGLTPVAIAAERRLPEDVTHRAATVAWALTRWGFDVDTVISGYRHALAPLPEPTAAVALAAWVARLHAEDFDLHAWAALERALRPRDPVQDPRLREVWSVAFPG